MQDEVVTDLVDVQRKEKERSLNCDNDVIWANSNVFINSNSDDLTWFGIEARKKGTTCAEVPPGVFLLYSVSSVIEGGCFRQCFVEQISSLQFLEGVMPPPSGKRFCTEGRRVVELDCGCYVFKHSEGTWFDKTTDECCQVGFVLHPQ